MAPRRVGRGLAVYAAVIPVAAGYGAAGLVFGFLPGIDVLRPRLPFDSTILGGLALLLVVGVPTTGTAVLAWRHDSRAAAAARWSGALLVGWIVVEVLLIEEFSPLQPIFALLGLGLVAWGLVPGPVLPRPAGEKAGSISPRGGSSGR